MKRWKAIIQLRRLRHLQLVPEKRLNVKTYAIVQMFVYGICIFCSSFLVNYMTRWLKKEVPNDDNWAVALIALPVAFFAISISIHISIIQKRQFLLLNDLSIGEIYKNSRRLYDFRPTVVLKLLTNFVLWIIIFINNSKESKNAALIVYSILMLFDCLYLIVFDIILFRESEQKKYSRFFISNFNYVDRVLDTDKSIQNNITEIIVKNEYGFSSISMLGESFCGTAKSSFYSLLLAISTNNATSIQKSTFLQLFKEVSKMKLKKSSSILTNYLIRLGKDMFNASIKNNDLEYSYEILGAMRYLYDNKKIQFFSIEKKLKTIMKVFDNADDLTTNEKKNVLSLITALMKNVFVMCTCQKESYQNIDDCFKIAIDNTNGYSFISFNCFSELGESFKKDDLDEYVSILENTKQIIE